MSQERAVKVLQSLWKFFACYRAAPRPESVPLALRAIRDLNLLRDPIQRFGIAGAIHGIAKQHPEEVVAWRLEYANILDECEGLDPDPYDDLEIKRIGELDYLFMAGLVGGDDMAFTRLVRLAKDRSRGDLSDAAFSLVHRSRTMPEMMEALVSEAPEGLRQELDPKRMKAEDAARALAMHLDAQPFRLSVVLVEVLAGEEGHLLQIVGAPGADIPNLPEWQGYPVSTREAEPTEMAERKDIEDQLLGEV